MIKENETYDFVQWVMNEVSTTVLQCSVFDVKVVLNLLSRVERLEVVKETWPAGDDIDRTRVVESMSRLANEK